jgi:hypothetical protein
MPKDPQSQLSPTTCLYEPSPWLYYQDIDHELPDFGLDNHRDIVWRDGSMGMGTDSSRCRSNEDSEVLEVFRPSYLAALYGRFYMDGAWTPDSGASKWKDSDVTAPEWRPEDSMKSLETGNISALLDLLGLQATVLSSNDGALLFSAHPGSDLSTAALWNCSFPGDASELCNMTATSFATWYLTATDLSSSWLNASSEKFPEWTFKLSDMIDDSNDTVIIVKPRDTRQEGTVQSDSGK